MGIQAMIQLCELCRGGFRSRRKDPQPLDPAIGRSDNLHAQAYGFEQDNLAGQRNAALDLAHQAAERGGFVAVTQSPSSTDSPNKSVN